MKSKGRLGATLVEVFVALGIFFLVFAGAWQIFSAGARSGHQAVKYSSILQAAGTMRARLEKDLAASWVPNGKRAVARAFRISADQRSLTFLRSGHVDDPEAQDAPMVARRWVRWSATPGPQETFIVKREALNEGSVSWDSAPATHLQFSLIENEARTFLKADFLLVDSDAAARPEASKRQSIPLRVIKRLKSPGRIPHGLLAFPKDLLGNPPNSSVAPRDLLGGVQPLEPQ